jgi:hypothetical protein
MMHGKEYMDTPLDTYPLMYDFMDTLGINSGASKVEGVAILLLYCAIDKTPTMASDG